MIKTIDLIKKIIALSEGDITHLKLQKLCYYCQAWHYTFHRKPLIGDDFVAMDKGPSSPDISEIVVAERNGTSIDSSVEKQAELGSLDDNQTINSIENIAIRWLYIPNFKLEDSAQNKFIDTIYSLYGDYTGEMLSKITHQESPWLNARGEVVYDDKPTPIKSKDMIEQYSKQAFFGVISEMMGYDFNYKRYVIVKNQINVRDLVGKEIIGILKFIVKELEISILSEENRAYKGTHDGKVYEFIRSDNNILLVTDEVKEHIMNEKKAKATSAIKELLDSKKLNYFWQYNDENEQFYAYTLVEAGIMVNEKTFNETVEKVIELLKYTKEYYDNNDCRPQDSQEKELINKLYLLVTNNVEEFLNLLGLNEESQLQGEKLNAN